MDQAASSSSISSINITYADHLTGRRVPLSLGADGNPLAPAQLCAQIKTALALIRAETRCCAHRSLPGYERRVQEPQPFIGHIFEQVSAPLRVMFRCVATACQRLAAAPVDMHVTHRTTRRWAECVMERVSRGRVRRVQVRLQRHACCSERRVCQFLRSRCASHARRSELWMVFVCVATAASAASRFFTPCV